jgi:hypothetical protein
MARGEGVEGGVDEFAARLGVFQLLQFLHALVVFHPLLLELRQLAALELVELLAQAVPDAAKNEAALEMELYLATMIRQVDSSLLDEWEKLRNPAHRSAETKDLRPPGAEAAAADVTHDTKSFTAAVRTRVFTFLRGLVNGDFDAALAQLAEPCDAESRAWTPERLTQFLENFHAGHQFLCLDPEARNTRHTYVTPSEDRRTWRVQQMLVDPEAHNDWVAEFTVDLDASRAAREPALRLLRLGPLA